MCGGVGVCARVHMYTVEVQKPQDNLWESVLFYRMRFGGKRLYPLSHLTRPECSNLDVKSIQDARVEQKEEVWNNMGGSVSGSAHACNPACGAGDGIQSPHRLSKCSAPELHPAQPAAAEFQKEGEGRGTEGGRVQRHLTSRGLADRVQES